MTRHAPSGLKLRLRPEFLLCLAIPDTLTLPPTHDRPAMNEALRITLGLATATIGALLAMWLALPLPWMIGALLATAISKMAGSPAASHKVFRNGGQWVIGASLGLYFTPEMVRIIGLNLPFIAAGTLFALGLGALGSLILRSLGGTDFKTAWFASAIGGASEMTTLAERYHARPDLVASAHSLRMLMVVVIIPFAFRALDIHGNESSLPQAAAFFDASGMLVLIVLTSAMGLFFQRRHLPNPWVLGPLLVTALLTSNGIVFTHLPAEMTNLGQLLIGWSLGDKFGPDFFRRAPRYLGVVALSNCVNIMLAFAFGYVVFLMSGIPFPTLVLGTSPGGIAEMAITAKVLMLGAPVVTSFHVIRMVCVLLLTGPLYRMLEGRRAKRGPG